jgi:hypothetical protein
MNCWRTHLESRILDYRKRTRSQPLRFPGVPPFGNGSDKEKRQLRRLPDLDLLLKTATIYRVEKD